MGNRKSWQSRACGAVMRCEIARRRWNGSKVARLVDSDNVGLHEYHSRVARRDRKLMTMPCALSEIPDNLFVSTRMNVMGDVMPSLGAEQVYVTW